MVEEEESSSLDWTVLEGTDKSNGKAKLCGRSKQEAELRQAFQRCCQRDNALTQTNGELILISGPPGSGKTALAQGLKETAESSQGFFLLRKFDQLERPETCYRVVQTFTEFAHILMQGTREEKSYLATLQSAVRAYGETNLVWCLI